MTAAGLRVSFVADTEGWGGAEAWLVHHLCRAADHGVVASVVCAEEVVDRLRPWVEPGRLDGVPLARHASAAPATAAALRAQRPDVVLVNLVDPASNAATVRAPLAVAPNVAALHLVGDVREGGERAALAALYARLELLLTPSEEGADLVRRTLAVPRSGIAVTCNGVDVPPDPRGPAANRPPVVGGYGRLTRQKGYDVLLDATRLLLDRGVELELRLGGAGRDGAALREQARGLPVSFEGWVDEPRSFLAGLDVFCLPSRSEALPLALLEAMAEGLPCVATDVGDVRRRAGAAVELVPVEDAVALADALERLLRDPGRRAGLGAAARRCVEEHLDADETARVTYTLLAEAAATAGRRAAS